MPTHQTAPTQFVEAVGILYPDGNHGAKHQYPGPFVSLSRNY